MTTRPWYRSVMCSCIHHRSKTHTHNNHLQHDALSSIALLRCLTGPAILQSTTRRDPSYSEQSSVCYVKHWNSVYQQIDCEYQWDTLRLLYLWWLWWPMSMPTIYAVRTHRFIHNESYTHRHTEGGRGCVPHPTTLVNLRWIYGQCIEHCSHSILLLEITCNSGACNAMWVLRALRPVLITCNDI